MKGRERTIVSVDRSDRLWLQHVLSRAVAENWCMQMNCTTCGALEFRGALGFIERDAAGYIRRRPLNIEEGQEIAGALRHCTRPDTESYKAESGIMLTLYEIWCIFGDEAHNRLFPSLDGSWAGEILARMRTHYQQKLERRRIHDARQGVKKRDWTV